MQRAQRLWRKTEPVLHAGSEAVESAVWLYEVAKARDPLSLIAFDSTGAVSAGMFDEHWTRYVLKLATGAGKTKVASLLRDATSVASAVLRSSCFITTG